MDSGHELIVFFPLPVKCLYWYLKWRSAWNLGQSASKDSTWVRTVGRYCSSDDHMERKWRITECTSSGRRIHVPWPVKVQRQGYISPLGRMGEGGTCSLSLQFIVVRFQRRRKCQLFDVGLSMAGLAFNVWVAQSWFWRWSWLRNTKSGWQS